MNNATLNKVLRIALCVALVMGLNPAAALAKDGIAAGSPATPFENPGATASADAEGESEPVAGQAGEEPGSADGQGDDALVVRPWSLLPQQADIASGTFGGCSWRIDAAGALSIWPSNGASGTLNATMTATGKYAPWHDYASQVTSLAVSPGVIANAQSLGLFTDLAMGSADVGNLDVSQVTSLYFMFSGCKNLTSLDLSGWNTSRVTDASCAFYLSSKIESINLSGWDMSNVTTMRNMFTRCESLSSVDLEGMNLSKVTDMSSLFAKCSSLTSVAFPQSGTPELVNASRVFDGCSALQSLDLSRFDTGKVISMEGMFYECSGLTSLDLSGFDTTHVTNMEVMFSDCSGLTSLDLSSFNTSVAANLWGMFRDCSSLSELNLANFDTANVGEGGGLNALSWTMAAMFQRCYALNKLTLGPKFVNKAGDNVALPALPEANSNYTGKWAKAENAAGYTASELMALAGDDIAGTWQWQRQDATLGGDPDDAYTFALLYDSGDLVLQDGSAVDGAHGTLEQSWKSAYHAGNHFAGGYEDYPPWYGNRSDVKEVYIDDVIRPVRLSRWFSGCAALTTIHGIANLDTSRADSMNSLFRNCSVLDGLDVTGFDTSNVSDMGNMFNGCHSLSSLDVTHFNTSKTWDFDGMFSNCYRLTSLDVSKLDTSNASTMERMFYSCTQLASLDVSTFNTSNVTDMSEMFGGCQALTQLKLANLDTSKVRDIAGMFRGCKALTALDISHFNVANVAYTDSMYTGTGGIDYLFYDCQALEALALPDFSAGHFTSTEAMFSRCFKLSSLDLDKLNTSNVTAMRNMFEGCEALTELDLSGFDTSNVTNMTGMFYDCEALTSLDLRSFDTSKVTTMQLMFADCHELASVDLSSFRTPALTTMYDMFMRTHSLSTVDLSTFDTSHVTSMRSMFFESEGITKLDLSAFDTSSLTDLYWAFRDCPNLESLDLSSFDTSNVITTSQMLAGDSKLSSLTLGRNFRFVPEGGKDSHDDDVYNADVPAASSTTPYTGKWIKATDSTGATACTATELMDKSGAAIQGEWVWQQTGNAQYQDAYALLYESGDLVFQRGDAPDPAHGTLSQTFSGFEADGSRPWNTSATSGHIVRVLFDNTVRPAGMVSWFEGCQSLLSVQGLAKVDTADVKSTCRLFSTCTNLASLNLTGFDTSGVVNMSEMFRSCFALSAIDVSGFDTAQVVDMSGMFNGCSKVEALDLSGFNTARVTDMSGMFNACYKVADLKLSSFNTSAVSDMSNMFNTCKALTELDVSGFNTGNVTDMTGMFANCALLTSLDLSTFDTAKVESMKTMFWGDLALASLTLSGLDTSSVKDMSNMFYECSFESLDLSSFDTSSVTNADSMFSTTRFSSLKLGGSFDLSKVAAGSTLGLAAGSDNLWGSSLYTNRWIRAADGATASSAELLARTGDDIAGTWEWEPTSGYRANRDGWGFANRRCHIPAAYYYEAYGDAMGRKLYESVNKGAGAQGVSDGVCYGMTATAISSSADGWPAVSSWGGAQGLFEVDDPATTASGTAGWTLSGSDLTALEFVERAHLAQLDWAMYFQDRDNMVGSGNAADAAGLVAAVKAQESGEGDCPVVMIYQGAGAGGHALWPLRVIADTASETVLAVYDCNYPGQERPFFLYKSSGAYAGWQYELDEGVKWGTGYDAGARVSWNFPTQVLRAMMARKGSYDDRERFNEVFRKRLIRASAALSVKAGGETYELSGSDAGDGKLMKIEPVGYTLSSSGAEPGSGASGQDGEQLYWVDLDGDVTFDAPAGGAEVSLASASGGVDVKLPEGSSADVRVAEGSANAVKVAAAPGEAFEVAYFEDDSGAGDGSLADLRLEVTGSGEVETAQSGSTFTVTGATALTVVNDGGREESKQLDPTRSYTVIPASSSGDPVIADKLVAKPSVNNFAYDGKVHAGVAAGEGYALSGTLSATAPGTYRVVASLKDGYAWTDGSVEPVSLTWTISGSTYQTMHRLYNPNSGEHFYTASTAERDMLRGVGWAYEGEGWKAPKTGANVYRLYNANAGDHHYTTSAAERDYLVGVGWNYEGVGWKSGGSRPLYRQYNPNAVAGSHNYTTSKAENDWLASLGWRPEGVGWYGV